MAGWLVGWVGWIGSVTRSVGCRSAAHRWPIGGQSEVNRGPLAPLRRPIWQIDINIVTFVTFATPMELWAHNFCVQSAAVADSASEVRVSWLVKSWVAIFLEKKAPAAKWIAATGLVNPRWPFSLTKSACGELVSSNRACQILGGHFQQKERLRQDG